MNFVSAGIRTITSYKEHCSHFTLNYPPSCFSLSPSPSVLHHGGGVAQGASPRAGRVLHQPHDQVHRAGHPCRRSRLHLLLQCSLWRERLINVPLLCHVSPFSLALPLSLPSCHSTSSLPRNTLSNKVMSNGPSFLIPPFRFHASCVHIDLFPSFFPPFNFLL